MTAKERSMKLIFILMRTVLYLRFFFINFLLLVHLAKTRPGMNPFCRQLRATRSRQGFSAIMSGNSTNPPVRSHPWLVW